MYIFFVSHHSKIKIKSEQPSLNQDTLQIAQKTIDKIWKKSNVLNKAFSYEFDIFELVEYTERPLLVLGVYLLTHSSVFSKLFKKNTASLQKCARFLDLCEKLYKKKNPYHNSIHGADVVQFNHILLCSSFMQRHFTDYECLASFMSAVAHDIGHLGKNNDFLIKSQHALAIKFKNISCLEQYHVEQFYQTLFNHGNANWIEDFEDDIQQNIIDIVEFAIIGTDMEVYHNAIKSELSGKYTKEFVGHMSELSKEEKKFLIRSCLHLSDISNPMRLFPTSRKWAARVNDEFFAQVFVYFAIIYVNVYVTQTG